MKGMTKGLKKAAQAEALEAAKQAESTEKREQEARTLTGRHGQAHGHLLKCSRTARRAEGDGGQDGQRNAVDEKSAACRSNWQSHRPDVGGREDGAVRDDGRRYGSSDGRSVRRQIDGE